MCKTLNFFASCNFLSLESLHIAIAVDKDENHPHFMKIVCFYHIKVYVEFNMSRIIQIPVC